LRKLACRGRVVKCNLHGSFFEETPVSLRLPEMTVTTSYSASRAGIVRCHHFTHNEAETPGAVVCNFALSGKRTKTYESYLPGVTDRIQSIYEKTRVLTPGYPAAQLLP
jgi:uncharacterized protein YodC (DUF2158 family)